ncbi:hypothetical protein EYF80_015501 [Liparis tanakae]|uniref:Uncharacterized protein n=1 Tax=Liparis tanakae TaxID=230148 RepID=A0A4Z2I8H4_9TELE|nr:hypothetical protein EYF80_015501 [Liparis tanakae]
MMSEEMWTARPRLRFEKRSPPRFRPKIRSGGVASNSPVYNGAVLSHPSSGGAGEREATGDPGALLQFTSPRGK